MAQPVDVEIGDKVMVPTERARDVEMDTLQTNSSDAKLSETYMRQQTGDDDVLVKKMVHVNRAINEIGWTKYHLKLFFLNGFGYAVDSMLVVCQSIAQPAIRMEFEGRGVTQLFAVSLSSAVGLLFGGEYLEISGLNEALVWGLSADMIGRKLAFNSSLFICALFVVIAGAMPNYIAICAMVAIYSAGAGGNYAIDATIFLEFLPWRYGFLTTILAIWWGVGYLIAGLLAWAFLPNFSCESAANCTWDNNKGWRLLHFTAGGIVLIAAIARLLIFKIEHSPKWLITQRRDAEAVEIIQGIAKKTGRSCTLALEQLEEEGEIKGNKESIVRTTTRQMANLFSTRKQMFATGCLFFLWLLIGLADPLYSTFRPYYLATRGFEDGEADPNITWRNYTLSNFAGLVGPLFAWPLLDTPYIRRRGTLAIGAALSMAFLFGFTQVTNATQNLVISCFITAVQNIFYGALYGTTSELLPTGSRGTGYGLAVGLNRTGNIMANIIGTYADVTSTAPLFVCAALYGGLVIVSLILPFDPSGNQIG